MAARSRKFIWLFIIIGVVGTAAAGSLYIRPFMGAPPEQTSAPAAPSGPLGVSSIGRIQSEDGPITIGARSLSGQPSIVRKLFVKEGDYVKAGQVVATLNSKEQLEAAWRQAETRIKVAEARRDQVVAGPKTADIAAQEQEIARLELELANARTEYARIENLFNQGIVSRAALDQSRLAVDTKPKLISAARERLRSMTEIRQIDVDVAAAELQAAIAEAQRAKAEAEAATIRSPYSGRVQMIHAWEGEEVGPSGILELAKVDKMFVVAEVADTDIPRVKVGQRAVITGDSLPKKLEGQVVQIGFKVSRNSLAVRNPVSLSDARIVEVKILLDDGSAVTHLIDGQVEVLILP